MGEHCGREDVEPGSGDHERGGGGGHDESGDDVTGDTDVTEDAEGDFSCWYKW